MNKKPPLLATCLLVLICISAIPSFAQGPGVKENSWIIDGDNYTAKKCSLDIKINDFKSNYYAKGSRNTTEVGKNVSINVSGKNDIDFANGFCGLKITFLNFDSVGTYNLADTAISLSIFFKKETTHEEYDKLYVVDGAGELKITKFDKVGGLIEGTFSGDFSRLDFDSKSGIYTDKDITLKISDGRFSVVRYPDYNWAAPKSTGAEPEEFKNKKK